MKLRLKEVIYTPRGPIYISVDSDGNFVVESEADHLERTQGRGEHCRYLEAC